jgi:phosphatidylserine/phosphatidylglycerophosphate/cardiolipin synthase-like enzyme
LSLDPALVDAVAKLAASEGHDKVVTFATAVERGDVELSITSGALQARLGIPQARLRAYRETLLASSNVRDLALALRAAAETALRIASDQPLIEVVWTYPGRASPGARTTGGAAREIIDGSRLSLLLVGYSITVDTSVSGLATQTVDAIAQAAERGVVVTAVLHRDANRSALLQAWRSALPPPAIFTWPLANDQMAAVHAKLLIADRKDGLITSANLTYHGFERNLEMGLRVTGRAVAEIHDRFHELIAAGDLVPWSG